jgi:hypothetical protein
VANAPFAELMLRPSMTFLRFARQLVFGRSTDARPTRPENEVDYYVTYESRARRRTRVASLRRSTQKRENI